MTNRLYLCVVISMLILSFEASGQRKRDSSPLDVTQLSEDIALKAESTLIEAEKEMILENYSKAYDLFQVALGLNPENATIHFKIAEVLSKNGESRKAVQYIEEAIELDQTNKYYHVLAAEIYKSLSEYDQALSEYEYLVEEFKGTNSYLFDIAIIYQFQGKNEQALATYDRIESIYGLNEFILKEKQKIYLNERNYDALIADWDKLINAYPDNHDFTIQLSEFLLQRNMIDEARERLETLLVRDPGNMKAELLLSQISLRSGDLEEAIRLAESTLSDSVFNYKAKFQLLNALVNLAVDSGKVERVRDLSMSLAGQYQDQYEVQAFVGDLLYKMGEERSAVDYYLNALKIDQSDFKVWQNILNIEMRLEAYNQVINHAEAALEYFPNQAILYFFSGTANQMVGDYQQAVNVLETGKKYAIEDNLIVLFQGQLGDSYHSLEMYDKSDAAYEVALSKDPENSHVLNNYSYFLSLRSVNLEKALKMSARLVELHPDDGTFLDTHGWVLYSLGEYEEALKYLEKAANLVEDGTVIEHLGDVLFRLGRVDEAVKQWERASRLDDASENIEKKISDRKLYE